MAACSDAARARFPAGLFQPPDGYHFGEEAILLAAFCAKFWPRAKTAADLGAGCGAALLGLLLLLENARGLGIERKQELVERAIKNAALLDLPAEFVCADLAGKNPLPKIFAGKFDLTLTNPPWRGENSGRRSRNDLRDCALRARGDILPDFFSAANFLLRHKGNFCLILPASGVVAAFDAARYARFGARFLLPLKTPAPNGRCERVILALKKGAKDDLQILDPVLVEGIHNGDSAAPWPQRTLRITELF